MDEQALNYDELARLLRSSPDHRVLERFKVGDSFGDVADSEVGSVSVIDFETTGVEDTDVPVQAIEIGIVRVEYGLTSGRLGRILDRYSALEDPGMPIPDHIVALTGITDDQVRGKRFDDERIQQIAQASSLFVAHNAGFDRRLGERRFPFLERVPWACSQKDIPWAEAGIGSAKLEFIALSLGWFHDGHRALNDCEVTAGILSREVMEGKTGMRLLLDWARQTDGLKHKRVWATGAPYASRSLLKARGYEWKQLPDGDGKAWVVETKNANDEIGWIAGNVLTRGGSVLVEEVGPRNRYTDRRISFEMVDLKLRA